MLIAVTANDVKQKHAIMVGPKLQNATVYNSIIDYEFERNKAIVWLYCMIVIKLLKSLQEKFLCSIETDTAFMKIFDIAVDCKNIGGEMLLYFLLIHIQHVFNDTSCIVWEDEMSIGFLSHTRNKPKKPLTACMIWRNDFEGEQQSRYYFFFIPSCVR